MKHFIHPILFLVLYFALMVLNEIYALNVFENKEIAFVGILGSYIILKLIFLNRSHKIEIITFWIIAYLLFLPQLHQLLYDWNPAFRFRYVLFASTMLLASFLYFALKSNWNFRNQLKGLSLITSVLMLSEMAIGLVNIEKREKINDFIGEAKFESIDEFKRTPNVYHLIFDGYTGFIGLEENWNFEDSTFMSCLDDYNIDIARGAMAGHEYTLKSMAGVFHKKDFSDAPEIKGLAANSGAYLSLIKHNPVVHTFQENGYKILNYSFFDLGDEKRIFSYPWFESELNFPELFYRKSTLGVIQKTISGRQISRYNQDVLKNINNVVTMSGKRYMYAHLIMPHSPNNFDAEGNLISSSDTKESYIAELQFCNKVICEFLDKIETHDPEAIVIIQSDHGSAKYDTALDKLNILSLLKADEDVGWTQMKKNHQTYLMIFSSLTN